MARKSSETATFEEQLKSLESVVERLEKGDLPLEEALEQFEQGVASAAHCQKLLKEVETRVEALLKTRDGALQTEPFQAGQD